MAADDLAALVSAELAEPVAPEVARLAEAIAAGHPGSLGVLFYGSCLRDTTLSGMLDFYLIVEDYRRAYGGGWRALANRLLPPNVFPFAKDGLAAKYAVLSLDHLRRESGFGARDASTYARLAQPTRLAWTSSDEARVAIGMAVARASETLLTFAAPLVPETERGDPLEVWRAAFAGTYRTELRAERAGRGDAIIDAEPDRYRRFAVALRGATEGPWTDTQVSAARAGQRHAERSGKRRQLMKLAKASLTFAGGLDYLAWKINRHAGTDIVIRPWQRRWPILGAISLLPRLLARGAVR